MIQYQSCTVLERLHKLYSKEEAQAAFQSIQDLIVQYKDQIMSENYRMSQEDVILITYGDSIKQQNTPPLKTLSNFENKYLKDIINTIHILPFYPYSSDDGFSVIDYKAVDPKLGTWEEVKDLSYDCRLMFDCVINHMSQHSEWFQGYLNGDEKYQDYFRWWY